MSTLTSCDFVGDEGCSDGNCERCHPAFRRCPHHGPQTLETCPLCGEPTTPAVPAPCCKRLPHRDVSRYETTTTWCTRPEGHDGDCAGPEPTILVPNRFGPADSQRRRW